MKHGKPPELLGAICARIGFLFPVDCPRSGKRNEEDEGSRRRHRGQDDEHVQGPNRRRAEDDTQGGAEHGDVGVARGAHSQNPQDDTRSRGVDPRLVVVRLLVRARAAWGDAVSAGHDSAPLHGGSRRRIVQGQGPVEIGVDLIERETESDRQPLTRSGAVTRGVPVLDQRDRCSIAKCAAFRELVLCQFQPLSKIAQSRTEVVAGSGHSREVAGFNRVVTPHAFP